MTVRLIVDSNVCQGHGRCYTLNAPAFMRADNLNFAAPQDREILVPPEHDVAARDAVADCSEGAIRLVEI